MNIIKNFIEQHGITEQQLIDGYKQGLQIILENASKISKQETLEEAAYNYASKKLQRPITIYAPLEANVAEYVGFIAGANWQSERMYSEEEVIRIIQECKSYLSFGDEFDEIEWFKENKK